MIGSNRTLLNLRGIRMDDQMEKLDPNNFEPEADTLTEMDVKEHGHTHHHEHRQVVLNRLSRIEGHVRSVARMVEKDTHCPEILIQIAAIRSALNSVGRVILEDHVKSCLIEAVDKNDFESSFNELKNSLNQFIR
jgi:CsoR family transcriptional regulator, copper-sensing transcriptional repressor